MEWILKRQLSTFNLTLEWNGKEVLVKNNNSIIDLRDAKSLVSATEEMTKLEDSFMEICGAMC
jgi:hypothetical protein